MAKKNKKNNQLVENDPSVERVSGSENEPEALTDKVEEQTDNSKEEPVAPIVKKEKVLNGTPRFNKFNK